MRPWVVTLLCGGLAAGCLPFRPFDCDNSLQCDPGGVCEAEGHCSYDDAVCDSGRRFGPYAGDLADTCVPATPGGDGGGSDGSGAGDGSGATSTGDGSPGGSSGDGGSSTAGTSGADTGTATASGSTTSCPGDTGGNTGTGCGQIAPDGAIIDNDDPCFELNGPEQWWRHETAGFGGSLVWTFTTDLVDPTNFVVWRLTFAQAGEYRVDVYIDPQHGQSMQADYQINHAGGTDTVILDQSASSGWTTLGEFQFDYLGGQWVRLHDNTGEPNASGLQLVFDAVRVTRIDGGGTGGCG